MTLKEASEFCELGMYFKKYSKKFKKLTPILFPKPFNYTDQESKDLSLEIETYYWQFGKKYLRNMHIAAKYPKKGSALSRKVISKNSDKTSYMYINFNF